MRQDIHENGLFQGRGDQRWVITGIGQSHNSVKSIFSKSFIKTFDDLLITVDGFLY